MSKKITYKTSGVDIKKANIFVDAIKKNVASTHNLNVISKKGLFGSLFSLDTKKYKNPVLVSSTDGVGTKLLVANAVNKHDTVGIDLVAMNVNDILCVGAKPLFFLDYIACGELKPSVLKQVVGGVVKGCKQSNCSLIGGETAEMPGMYKKEDYDLAGFAVGIVDKKKIIDGSKIKSGDVIIGLASNGLHSNGFSLARKILGKNLKKYAKELIAPTKIYVKEVLSVLDKFKVKGMAHITGGAYYEKLTKILPKGKCFAIDRDGWVVPEIFNILQEKGNVSDEEMYRTFNMGIGMVLVVDKAQAANIMVFLNNLKIKNYLIGEVVNDTKRKVIL
ncbi:MAG: phosphoribosylformylglycinamidine cyclo-ligase [Candidatus Zapsychrus exili]|nr:phosphoribosylformylglycinamidine cyclo-ligase [Candidatus Zapsychrus exili]